MNPKTDCICFNCRNIRPEERGPCSVCGDTRRTLHVQANEQLRAADSLTPATRWRPQTWGYIHMVIGLLIAIATTMISVLDFPGWARAIVIPCVAIIIIVVLVDNGGVQNFLLRIKRTYEDKAR